MIQIQLNQLTHIKHIHITYSVDDIDPILSQSIQQAVTPFEYTPFNLDTLANISLTIKNAALESGYYDVLVTRGYTSINRYTNHSSHNHIVSTDIIKSLLDW